MTMIPHEEGASGAGSSTEDEIMSASLEQGVLGPESKNDLPWHKDEWGSGSYLYQNVHGSVGYVDGPGSNPGLVRVIKVFGNDRAEIRDRIAFALSASAPAPGAERMTAGEDILAETHREFQRRNGYHRREIEELLTEFGELLLSKVQPAPATPPGVPDSVRALLKEAADVISGAIGPQHPVARKIDAALATHPAGQSAGSGADVAAYLHDLDRVVTVPPGDPRLDTLVGPAGPAVGLDGYGSQARPLSPAPDSTRTGDEGTEELRDLAKQIGEAADDEFADWQIDMVVPVLRAALAARPAAPSDAGWIFDMEAAPRDGTNVIVAVASIHEGHEPIVGQAFIDTDNGGHWWWAGTSHGDYYASPIHETNNPPYAWYPMLDAPAPPSSGQGGR